jgi:predicted alpha/beta superfamily hydrolase
MVKANKLAEESHRDFLGEVSSYLDQVAKAEADAATEITRAWGESLGGLFSGFGTAMDMYN